MTKTSPLGFDDKATEAEEQAAYLVASAPIGFLDCLAGIIQHVAVGPAEAGNADMDELLYFGAVRTGVEGVCEAVPNAECVIVCFAGLDGPAALRAFVRLARLDGLVAEHAWRIVVAITVDAHDGTPLTMMYA